MRISSLTIIGVVLAIGTGCSDQAPPRAVGSGGTAGQPTDGVGMPGGAMSTAGGAGSSGTMGTGASSQSGSAGNPSSGGNGGDAAGAPGGISAGGLVAEGGAAGAAGSAPAGSSGSAGTAGSSSAPQAWSEPRSLVDDLGRLAIGNRVHLVGHKGGELIHLSSSNNGWTWGPPTVISAAAGNYPAMYGGLFAQQDKVYLLTADDDMASSAGAGGRVLKFRKSTDNGSNWTSPIDVSSQGTLIFRVRIAASGDYVHVVGTSQPGTDASLWYFRSSNGGGSFETPAPLATGLGTYGGGQTVAVDGNLVHVAYTKAMNGVGAGPTLYIRSTNNGTSFSQPVPIGEDTAESSRQARVQLAAADGRVFACWQREGAFTGAELPSDRIGYARSLDGGQTWQAAHVLLHDTGIDRNHQHTWMAPGGGVHILWRHGNTAVDAAGYMHSSDYGATWSDSGIAIDTDAENHPWGIVAGENAVHAITGPSGSMQYASKLLQ